MKRRPKHALAHPDCEHGSWAACDGARRVSLGRCSAFTGEREPKPCGHWATGTVEDSPLCGTHATSVLAKQAAERVLAERQAALTEQIDSFIAHTQQCPSYWACPHRRSNVARKTKAETEESTPAAEKTSGGVSPIEALVARADANKVSAPTSLVVPRDILPNDLPGAFMSTERMQGVAKDLRRHAAELLLVADAIDTYVGRDSATPSVAVARAIDQRFEGKDPEPKVDLVEKAAEIFGTDELMWQSRRDYMRPRDHADICACAGCRAARVYADAGDVVTPETQEQLSKEAFDRSFPQAVEQNTWKCPTHATLGVQKTSKRGKKYVGCPSAGCAEIAA